MLRRFRSRGDCAGAEQAGAELVQKSTRGDWAGAEARLQITGLKK